MKERLTGRGEPAPDPRVVGGPTEERLPDGQLADHWILSDEDRAKGFVRPVRRSYVHQACGAATSMPQKIAETYATNPRFYGSTFCVHCKAYLPVGDFVWDDGSKVGT